MNSEEGYQDDEKTGNCYGEQVKEISIFSLQKRRTRGVMIVAFRLKRHHIKEGDM